MNDGCHGFSRTECESQGDVVAIRAEIGVESRGCACSVAWPAWRPGPVTCWAASLVHAPGFLPAGTWERLYEPIIGGKSRWSYGCFVGTDAPMGSRLYRSDSNPSSPRFP